MQYYSLLIAAYAIWHFVAVCSINNLFFSSFVNSVLQFNYFLVKYLSVCFFSFFSLYATYTVNKDVYIKVAEKAYVGLIRCLMTHILYKKF